MKRVDLYIVSFVFIIVLSLLSCKSGGTTTPDPNNGAVTPPDTSIAYGFKAEGKTVRFPKGSNISVYVYDGSSVSGYQTGYKGTAEKYVTRWNSIGDKYNLFHIGMTSSPDLAAVVVRWTESLGGNIAGQTTYSSQGSSLILPVDIVIATKVGGQAASSSGISMTALHEMGHALGLWQHSNSSRDVMYPIAQNGAFSKADIATIYLCYTTFADITAGGRGASSTGALESYTID
jgi:hypothetical protein